MVWIFLFKYNRQIINNNRFHYILILNEKTLKKILNMDSTSVAAMYVSCLKCLMLFFVVFSLGIRKCARNIKFNNIFIYSIF